MSWKRDVFSRWASIRQIDTGEMYAWDITELFKDPETGKFWIGSDSGCSCNWAWDSDYFDGSDFTEVKTLADVQKYISHFSTAEKAEFLSGLVLA